MAPKVNSCYGLWTFHTSSLLLLEPSTPSIMDLFQRLPLIGRNMGPRTGYIAWPPNDTFREDRSNKATCWSEPQQGHHWTGKPIKSSTSSGSDWTRWECRLTRPITGMMDGSGLFFLFVILLFFGGESFIFSSITWTHRLRIYGNASIPKYIHVFFLTSTSISVPSTRWKISLDNSSQKSFHLFGMWVIHQFSPSIWRVWYLSICLLEYALCLC